MLSPVAIFHTLSKIVAHQPGLHTVQASVLNTSELEALPAIIAAAIFLLVFIAISFHLLHETAAALLGAAAVLLISYIWGTSDTSMALISFEEAMLFVDWNVIFLIMGMMIFVAVLAETNIFRWAAFRLYKASKGNVWRMLISLLILTAVSSALLNDVTVILLLVPLSIQIALAMDIHPFLFVIPEVLISNIGGAATLIGNPPSTIVGSHIGVSFLTYLVNMGPIALICILALFIVIRIQYRRELGNATSDIQGALMERLESESILRNLKTLRKALLLLTFTFVLFFASDRFGNLPPGVIALSGAALVIAWVRPEMHSMLREVDWTTLLFFIGLFIVVGAMDATGAIGWAASRIAVLAGQSADLASMLTLWISGIASAIVANIPFTVAALPVADFLTGSIPAAADSGIVYWSLILGADLGGNATILGSAPNIVAVGLLAQAGYRLSFGRFVRDGLPITIVTLLLSSLYLILRY
jgi:Na+/H+ antiporter NhaD/arsenite permease-like protein